VHIRLLKVTISNIETTETVKIETTVTAPPATGASVIAGKGAPMKDNSETSYIFHSTQNFPDIEPARQFAKKLTRKEQY
jgi:hypothetical protein